MLTVGDLGYVNHILAGKTCDVRAGAADIPPLHHCDTIKNEEIVNFRLCLKTHNTVLRTSSLVVNFIFGEDGFFAEITDQVKGDSQGNDVLEKEQAREAHVPYPVNGNRRARGSYHHRAGGKEHDACDKPTDDTGLRLKVACDHKQRGSPFGKAD